jgi:hypothetical protein
MHRHRMHVRVYQREFLVRLSWCLSYPGLRCGAENFEEERRAYNASTQYGQAPLVQSHSIPSQATQELGILQLLLFDAK